MKCTVLLRCIIKQIRFQRLNLQGSQTVRGKRGSTRSDCWHVLFLGFYSRVETRYTDYGEFWHWNPSSKRRGSKSQFSPETETFRLKALRQRTSSQFVSSLNFKIHFVDAEQKKHCWVASVVFTTWKIFLISSFVFVSLPHFSDHSSAAAMFTLALDVINSDRMWRELDLHSSPTDQELISGRVPFQQHFHNS